MNPFINPLGMLLRDYYEHATWTKAAAALVKQHHIDMDEVSARAGILTTASCSFAENGLFDFDYEGEEAAIIEALADDAETTIDLCAWSIARPEIFGTALGSALVLGEGNIHNPATWSMGGLLKVHRRPLDWLIGRCRGVVILDHRFAPYVLGQALGAIVAEDTPHARDLKLMLCQPPVNPADILVPVGLQRRAA